MAVTVEQFIERLTQSGLMSAAEVSTFQDSLPPDKRPKDVQQLARVLVQHGKLTKYQAQAVWQGKTKGLVFGEYTVLDQIGEGGMGVVLKAQHRRMKRLVAIKVLSSAAMKQAGAVERFHREAEAAAKLSHPNIVTAYDATEHQGMHYLAMEYVEGNDLASVVKEHGPLPVPQAVECVLQAARGLQYAHEQGIVHRDIKPGNLLLDKKGTVKILDMGLARIAGAEAALGGAERLTTTGQVMGTCDYMAPEQSLDTHQADARADVYSLGCTLYRLLTGNPPYRGETFAKLFLMHLESPIPSLCEARPEVPEALDAICQRMLAKKPEDRYQSMAEVVAELEAVLGVSSGRSTAGTVAASDESPSEVVARTLAFLQEATPRGTLTQQKKSTADQRTQPHISPEHGTGANLLGKVKRMVGAARRRPLLLFGIGGGLVVLLVVVLTLTLRQGTLVVEIDEQLGKDVQVAVSQGGEKVQVADAKSGWTLSLDAGKYDLAVQGGDDQFQLDSQSITVTHGGQVKVKVTLKPAPLAVAPFDAKQARNLQDRWARQLGVPVEMTNAVGMKLVLIPPGEVTMGEGGDAHKVTITKAFYLGKYEVTQEEWEAVMGTDSNPSTFKGPRNPVEMVSWEDCQAFFKKINEKLGDARESYRLPTEAQWEYGCRAGSPGGWSFGDSEIELDGYGWYQKNSDARTHPVGQKKPNAWGLFDMYGNVSEWCADWFGQDYYKASPGSDPTGPPSGSNRVNRGGGWGIGAGCCRSAYRNLNEPGIRYHDLGFRVSLVLPDTAAGRVKMNGSVDAAQPSGGSTANKPSPAVASPDAQSPVRLPAVGSLVGADGKWKLPPGVPQPAVAPFDAAKAKEHQEGWAKHLGVPVEITNSIGMKLVLVPPGEFMMGSPKELIEEELKAHGGDQSSKDRLSGEGPQHRVRITKSFYLGMYLVTQGGYQRVMGVNPSEFSATGKSKDKVAGQSTKRFPVECVSWDDAVEFCRKLSEMPEEKAAGRWYRLPSEAQWEYACRAGSTGRYGFSSVRSSIPKEFEEKALSDYGWFGDIPGRPHAVGLKRASAWGLYDMHGNVWEWCHDWYAKDYYAKSPTDDPTGPLAGSDRVHRGCPWHRPVRDCRSARRFSSEPGVRDHDLGFRVSLDLADTTAERTKKRGPTDAAQPSGDANAPRASSESQISNLKSEIPAPPPAVAPFDTAKAKEHQAAWAKHLGVPVEITNSIGMKLLLIPPGEFEMGSPKELIEEELVAAGGDNSDATKWYKQHLIAVLLAGQPLGQVRDQLRQLGDERLLGQPHRFVELARVASRFGNEPGERDCNGRTILGGPSPQPSPGGRAGRAKKKPGPAGDPCGLPTGLRTVPSRLAVGHRSRSDGRDHYMSA
jgi:serine/threonine-protein kinase